jgi:CRISPR system Cascade subunit CasB
MSTSETTRGAITVRPEINRFLARLRELDPGSLARLRRNAGNEIADSRGVLPLFYRLLPRSVIYPRQAEAYFFVATLYALCPRPGGHASLAATLAGISRLPGVNREGVDRRMAILIDANRGELPFRLRQAVRFVASHDRPIPWESLLADVLRWEHPDRLVQRAWARAYFGSDS